MGLKAYGSAPFKPDRPDPGANAPGYNLNGHVAPDQRFTHGRTCPICHGSADDRRGQGERCYGFLSQDGAWAHCTREEAAGRSPLHAGSGCYPHRLKGRCPCGVEHAPADPAPARARRRKGEIDEIYDYPDAGGSLLFQVVRFKNPKGFRQRRPDGRGGFIWDLKGVETVLFNLPGILATEPGDTVVFAEGEKAVDALVKLGFVATCSPMGAGKWRDRYGEHLRGRHVVVLPDNDQPGRDHAVQVARSVSGVAASVKVVPIPGLPERGDAFDYFASGGTAEDLRRLIDESPGWTPTDGESRVEPDGDDDDDEPIVDRWPEIDEHAFYGPAGEIVRAVGPHTEADPVAILIQLLIAFLNLVGRGPYFVVGATRHYLNLFCALVGPTSTGRKGSAFDVVRLFMRYLDPGWEKGCIKSGLVSGEGLIYHVRDPTTKKQDVRAGRNGPVTGQETITIDEGVKDKRLLVVEAELGRVIKAMNRDSNTLSDVLRLAWDGDILRTMAKNSPDRATGAHVSVVGHITRHDVARLLAATDMANGFGNRFLWTAVRQSKDLPDGGNLFSVDFAPINRRLADAAETARTVKEMTRDAEAGAMWRAVYGELGAGRPGLLGAILSRAQPQVARLSCGYALLDGSAVVHAEHLLAALALWKYCEDSARFVFGDAMGDPDAEKLLTALRDAEGGLSRSEISITVFGKNKRKADICRLLGDLLSLGLIHRRTGPSTGGRPAERWFAGRKGADDAG